MPVRVWRFNSSRPHRALCPSRAIIFCLKIVELNAVLSTVREAGSSGRAEGEGTRDQLLSSAHMNNIFITIAIPKDARKIREVQKKAWLATYPSETHEITRQDIESNFSNPETNEKWILQIAQSIKEDKNVHAWVAKDKSSIVGYCFVRKEEVINRIMGMYVLPEYQGKGIGKELLEKAIEWLDGNLPTVLEVASYNIKAINFYKTFGFVENGATQNEVASLPTGKIIPEIEMVKDSLVAQASSDTL